jgi:hypothetical protein
MTLEKQSHVGASLARPVAGARPLLVHGYQAGRRKRRPCKRVLFIGNGYYTNSERNLFFWMDCRRAAHFFLFPLYLSLSPSFQPVMGGRKRKRKDKE